MRELLQRLLELLRGGEDAVLVTVVASSGSTPRGAGARMLVGRAGRLLGTIGGGAVERGAELRALEVLQNKRSHTEQFLLHKNQVADLGMICGGEVTVYFHYLPAGQPRILRLLEEMDNLFASGEQAWLICDITPEGAGEISAYGKKSGLLGAAVPETVLAALGNRPAQAEAEGRRFYCERLTRPGKVYIFGGGHVARELAPVLCRVEFTCVVLDDREEFVNGALFPAEVETRLADMRDLSAVTSAMTREDYACVMTRGHKDDYLVQRQLLRTPLRYIGVIGSARKTAGVQAMLRQDGFGEADFARITTPIGLPILAETPAEIAISVAAQMIMERAKRAERA